MLQYFIIYKPYLTLSQFTSEDGKQTLADVFDVPKDVYPVGRLDYDSEGLLILTNDKQLNHRLLHPKHAHQRTYWAQVDGAITPEALLQLQQGVFIQADGKPYNTRPCIATAFTQAPEVPERIPPIRVRKHIPAPWISLTLTEGKNRQVRKMTAAVGYPTLRLIRYSIEGLTLANMQPGNIISLPQKTLYKKLFHE
jgi:23S rRNA pseudouridine2457 synthase